MRTSRRLFVLACQQVTAVAVAAAVAFSALAVVELEIVPPAGEPREAAPAPRSGPRSVVAQEPAKPTVHTVDLQSDKATRRPQRNRVISKPQPVRGYGTVGVTWDSGTSVREDEVSVSVRTLEEGSWSAWQPMEYHADHGPDPGVEATGAREIRDGTEPVVVGRVDDVQVRAVTRAGKHLRGLSLAIVDPGTTTPTTERPEIDTGSIPGAKGDGLELSAADVSAPRPEIFSRRQWGADERLRDPGSLRYGTIRAGFVHHTVNANGYSRSQVPSILRGIYAYHTRSRGWSDIGYNFLIDRFGRIWEGRYGGVARPVVGAHTLGYNEASFAASAIGNFETALPSQAMLNAYGALMGWKLGLHGISATDGRQLVAGRYFKAINGHRDAGSTACPGRHLYARLPAIRERAADAQQGGSPPPPPDPEPVDGTPLNADFSGSEWPDLVVRDEQTNHALIVRTGGQLQFLTGATASGPWPDWTDTDLVVAVGDVNEDTHDDVLARSSTTGEAQIFHSDGAGSFTAGNTFARFSRVDQLTGVGDFDGDSHADLIGRRVNSKKLVLFRGTGTGSYHPATELAADWSAYDLTTGVADFNTDGHPDLITRAGEVLRLVPGTGSGIGTPVPLPGSWSGFDVLAGRGDVTLDGRPDLLAREEATGTTYVYPGDGAGALGPRVGGWSRYAGVRWLSIAGRLAGTPQRDLAGVTGTGLSIFAHSGRRNLGETVDTGTVLGNIDLLLNVGDWNGDGHGDVMTRSASSGALHFRAGLSGDRLAAPVVAKEDWSGVDLIAAVGDVTGDDNPDLVGRTEGGFHRVFPGNGANGFKDGFKAHDPIPGTQQITLGLWDRDEMPDQALRRADGTLHVRKSRTGSLSRVASGLGVYDWVRGLGDLNGNGRADVVVRSANGYLWLLPGRADGFGDRRLIGTGFDGYDLIG